MPLIEGQSDYIDSPIFRSASDSIQENRLSIKSVTDECDADFTWTTVDNNPLAIRFINN